MEIVFGFKCFQVMVRQFWNCFSIQSMGLRRIKKLKNNDKFIDNSQSQKQQSSNLLIAMSMSNFGRNPSMTQHETNNQKTLIYDLRSELSNLKNQFSRLITKPTDIAGKSKAQIKPAIKSRYSAVNLGQQPCNQPCSTSQIYPIIRAPESAKFQFYKSQSGHFHKNSNTGFDKINSTHKKSPLAKDSSNCQTSFLKNDPIAKTVQIKNQQSSGHLSPSKIKKQSQTIIYYRKNSNNADQISDKSSTISSKITDKSTQYLTSKIYKGNTYQDLNSQKIKKLEAQNQTNLNKVVALTQQVGQLTQKLFQSQKDVQQLQIKNTKKQQKIWKLEQNMREMTQKVGKANQQTLQIGKQKNKQLELIRQGHLSQLKNQQKDFQNRLNVQKKNIQLKYESMIKAIKQTCDNKLAQMNRERQKLNELLNGHQTTINKLNMSLNEVKQQKNAADIIVVNNKSQLSKNNEMIQHLKVKCSKLQNQLKEKKMKQAQIMQRKQIGVNSEDRAQSGTANTNNQASLQQQNKQLQDKLTNYLNNIDKQSTKLKQQKAQLERSQRVTDECNRIICDKDIMIRNLMRDCKNMQKDLNESRRVRHQLDLLLQDANSSAIRMQVERLNLKYKGV